MRLICALLMSLMAAGAAAGQVRTFTHLAGGEDLKRYVETEDRRGLYVVAYDPMEQDTVLVWFEHVGWDETPNRTAAKYADAVVWCYPKRNPHPRHVLPGESGEVVVYRQWGNIYVTTRSWSENHLPGQ